MKLPSKSILFPVVVAILVIGQVPVLAQRGPFGSDKPKPPKVPKIEPGRAAIAPLEAVPLNVSDVEGPEGEGDEAEEPADEGEGAGESKPTPAGLPPGLPPVDSDPGDEEIRMVVRLRDGTIIMGKPLTLDFPIETPYGRLLIPLKSLRSATFGLRIPEEKRKLAAEAISKLGGTDFKLRDQAQAILRSLGENGLSAIQEALDAGPDLETEKRLKAVLKEVAPEGLNTLLLDSLNAGAVRASGKITIDVLEVECSLGKLAISLDKLREIRSLGGMAFAENFENFRPKSANWETQANNNTVWQLSGKRSKDGKSAMWCGVKGGNQYSDNANSTLTSPPIDLSKLDSPVLQFSYWLKMEDGADTAALEFSKDGGSNWEGGSQFSSNGSWSAQSVDLSGYRSHNFRFRFRFQSDGSSVDEGMFVDGFSVGEADDVE